MNPSRVLLGAPLGVLLLSGCFFLFGNPADKDEKTYAVAKEAMEKRDYDTVADELLRLHDQYQLDSRSSGYRSLASSFIYRSFHEPAAAAEKNLKGDVDDFVRGAEQAQSAIGFADRILKLPLDNMLDKRDRPATIREKRDALAKFLDSKKEVFEQKIAKLNELEASGKPAMAYIGWMRFIPVSPEQKALRAEKLLSTGKSLYLAAGAAFQLDAGAGASPETRAAVAMARNRLIARNPGVRFVDDPKDADVSFVVKAGKMKVTHSAGKVTLETRVALGKEMAENYTYKSLSRDLARWEKEVSFYQRRLSSINCNRGQVRAPAGPCGKSEYNSLQNFSKKASDTRAKLAKTPRQKMQTKWATRNYPGDEKEVVAELPLEFVVKRKDGSQEKLTVPSRYSQKAISHGAHPELKVLARADKLIDDATAASRALARVEETLLDTMTDQLARLRKKRTPPANSDDKLLVQEYVEQSAITGKLGLWKPQAAGEMIQELLKPPLEYLNFERAQNKLLTVQSAMLWERLGAVAQKEEAENRIGNAAALRYEISDFDEKTDADRKAKLTELGPRLWAAVHTRWACAAPAGVDDFDKIQTTAARDWASAGGGLEFDAGSPELRCTIETTPRKTKHATQQVNLTKQVPGGDGEPPTEVAYPATEDLYTVESTATVRYVFGDIDVKRTFPVSAVVKKVSHPANEEAEVEARKDAPPTEDELKNEWALELARGAQREMLDILAAPPPNEAPAERANRLFLMSLRVSGNARADRYPWRDAFVEVFQVEPRTFIWGGGLNKK